MSEVTLNEETLRFMNLFQDITRTKVRDCLEANGRLVFVVESGQIGKAIGKGGENVVKMKKLTGRDIRVIEYSSEPEQFIRNVFKNYGVRKVEIESRDNITHATVTVEPTQKGKAIGRDGSNLKLAREIISRHHPIQSVSIA